LIAIEALRRFEAAAGDLFAGAGRDIDPRGLVAVHLRFAGARMRGRATVVLGRARDTVALLRLEFRRRAGSAIAALPDAKATAAAIPAETETILLLIVRSPNCVPRIEF
jgi:hypothetical protein